MGRIKINTAQVVNSTFHASSARSIAGSVVDGILHTKWKTDGKILGRNGISSRLDGVYHKVAQIERDILAIYTAANEGAMLYDATESNILNLRNTLGIIGGKTQQNTTVTGSNEKYFLKSELEDVVPEDSGIWTILYQMLEGGKFITEIPGKIMDGKVYTKAYELLKNGIKFSTKSDSSGKINLVLDNFKNYTHAQIKESLNIVFDNADEWTDYDIRSLINDGIAIYKKNGDTTKDLLEMKNNLSDGVKDLLEFDEALEYVKNAGVVGNIKDTGKVFGDTFAKEAIDFVDYRGFKEISNLEKVGKVAGSVGTGLDVITNVFDNLYDPDTGNWEISPKNVTSTVTDTAIDIGAGAAATAAGAAIGSFILPPVGTIVGGIAGFAINCAINYDGIDIDRDGEKEGGLFDWDKDGESDSLIDGAKHAVDKLIEGIVGW